MSKSPAEVSADALMQRFREQDMTTGQMRTACDRMAHTRLLRPEVFEILTARIFLLDHPRAGS